MGTSYTRTKYTDEKHAELMVWWSFLWDDVYLAFLEQVFVTVSGKVVSYTVGFLVHKIYNGGLFSFSVTWQFAFLTSKQRKKERMVRDNWL